MEGLTPGRIVHFVADVAVKADSPYVTLVTNKYDHVPALITGVDPEIDGMVHLSVFFPAVNLPVARINAAYDATGKLPGSWHWIERA